MWGSAAPLLSGRDEARVLSLAYQAGTLDWQGHGCPWPEYHLAFASPLSQGWLTIQGSQSYDFKPRTCPVFG